MPGGERDVGFERGEDAMAFREAMEKNQKLTTGVVTVLVLGAIGLVVYQNRPVDPVAAATGAYFSADDGASTVRADGRKTRELERQSPPVYQAAVFKPRDGGKEFVGYLTRLPPASQDEFRKVQEEYKKGMAAAGNNGPAQERVGLEASARMKAINATTEVKKPGAGNKWVLLDSAEGQAIVTGVKSPSGSGDLQMLLP